MLVGTEEGSETVSALSGPLAAEKVLPADYSDALLIGRVWDPETAGPRVCIVDGANLADITPLVSTVSQALENPGALRDIALHGGRQFSLSDVIANSDPVDLDSPHLLAPIDLQVVKACGVTFVDSMIERVIEEQCAGDPEKAEQVRNDIALALGGTLRGVRPGSARAAEIKELLMERDIWSAYLEVGIGPDPEVFTKAPVLASVGYGAKVGIPDFSSWNNPEPELVLLVNSQGTAVGATLGNDVNLRDVEGRSSLLLGKAKDNNASSALGPFVRVFDSDFQLETVAEADIALEVLGADGFHLDGVNSVSQISRPLPELVAATWGAHHQYPDGFALYTGTLFAPTQDRDTPGQGFTHHPGDRVAISAAQLGTLVNTTWPTEELDPWTWGIGRQMAYLRSVQAGDSEEGMS